jgi:peptide-methionine (S)-S-oxide reductase
MKPSIIALLIFLAASLHAESEPMKTEKATLGGGCFWCVEAVYERLPGILSVTSGYAGGQTENPTYEQIGTGKTGHAEVVQIDVGTQYRSIILTANDDEARIAKESRDRAQGEFKSPIVTEIVPLEKFYPAEDYHQDFYRENPMHPYNMAVIRPKLQKLDAKADGRSER